MQLCNLAKILFPYSVKHWTSILMHWRSEGSWLDFAFLLWEESILLYLSLWGEKHSIGVYSSNPGENRVRAWAFCLGLGFSSPEGWGGPSPFCPKEADDSGRLEPDPAKPEGGASRCFPRQAWSHPQFTPIDSSCAVPGRPRLQRL